MRGYLDFMQENSEHAKEFFDEPELRPEFFNNPEISEIDLILQLDVILEWISESGMDLQILKDLVTGLKESL